MGTSPHDIDDDDDAVFEIDSIENTPSADPTPNDILGSVKSPHVAVKDVSTHGFQMEIECFCVSL